MAEQEKTNLDEWNDKARRQADDFIKKWNEAPMKLWEKTARRLRKDFERRITGSWGAPSPSESESSTEDSRDSVERSIDALFAGIEGKQ